MSTIAEDMTRLREEMHTLRGSRKEFAECMRDTVSEMRLGFREVNAARAKQSKAERSDFMSDHAAMAKQSKAERSDFVSDLKQVAKQSKAERQASVLELKQEVGDMRRELAAELKGAHEAWSGQSAGASKADDGPRPTPKRRKRSSA